MANFDLVAKLLQDYTRLYDGRETVAGVVRGTALGRFLESCEAEIERQEALGGPDGVTIDSPCAIAVQHVSLVGWVFCVCSWFCCLRQLKDESRVACAWFDGPERRCHPIPRRSDSRRSFCFMLVA